MCRLLPSVGLLVFLCGSLANCDAICGAAEIANAPNSETPLLGLDTGGHTHAVYKLVVWPYKEQLISVGLDKTIRFWDMGRGEPLRVLRPPVGPGAQGCLFSVALSPEDNLLAVGTFQALTPPNDHRIHLIDLSTSQIVRSLKGHSSAIYDLAFSPDGERLASASLDTTVRVWDVKSGRTIVALSGHSAPVESVAWSADGKRIVSGSLDKTARIWSLDTNSATATTIAVLREHEDAVMDVAWSPDGMTIATGGNDKSIRLYEPGGQLRASWRRLFNQVTSLAFSPDSKRLAYTYGSNTAPPVGAAILDLANGRELVRYCGHENSPICCVFSTDGNQVATGDTISRIRIWNSATGATQHKLEGRGQTMFAAGWSRDGQAIAWGTRPADGRIDIGNSLQRTFCLKNLDFGARPDGTFVRARPVLGSLKMGFPAVEKSVNMQKLLFLRNGVLANTFTSPQPNDQIRSYTLLPESRAVIGTKTGAYLFDVKSGRVLHTLSDRAEDVWGLAPSPDNRHVLTAGNDQVLRVWGVESGEMLVALFVAGDEWIAWTPQGYYAASLAGESLMGWHLNRGPTSLADFYPAAQFHKSLYRPDVIRRLLETGALAKSIELADRERNQPSQVIHVADVLPADVKITLPTATRVEQTESAFTIRAAVESTNNQALTAVQLIIDGRPVGSAHPVATLPGGMPAAKVDVEWTVELPPGVYSVAVKAEAAHSFALSEPVEVARLAGQEATRPRLFVLSLGAAPGSNSAASISKAMSAAAPGVFSEVVTRVLEGEQATAANISAELEGIAKAATLADTTLVYYAGQESLDLAGGYRLSVAASRSQAAAEAGFSEKEFKRLLAAIRGHVLLALDTVRARQQFEREVIVGFCGTSVTERGADRLDSAADDFLRDLLTEECGIAVLRASRRAMAARVEVGPSPFAQAFTEGVGGRADRDPNGIVNLQELARYMYQRVREISGGNQVPVIERPRGVRSLPLAKPPPPPAKPGP